MKNKKILAAILLVLFLIGGGTITSLIFSRQSNNSLENTTTTITENKEVVLVFYTKSCPFCERLKEYINTNSEKIDLNIKLLKVDDPKVDKSNLELVLSKIKECNITDGWGVPFTYHNGKCIMGDQPAMEYFNQFIK